MLTVIASQPVLDEGSIVLFQGIDTDDGSLVMFAVDHRYAQALIDDVDAEADVEEWQVLARQPALHE